MAAAAAAILNLLHVRTVPGTRVTRKPQPDLVSLPDTGQYGPELGVLNLLYDCVTDNVNPTVC